MITVRGLRRWLAAITCLLVAGGVLADEYADGWGPAVGSRLPVLEAPDQTGTVRTLADLSGEQGLLLFLARSADW